MNWKLQLLIQISDQIKKINGCAFFFKHNNDMYSDNN